MFNYQIKGGDMQLVEIALASGDSVRAEIGSLMYMEDGIEMKTGAIGGIFSGLKRVLTKENFFLTSYSYCGVGGNIVVFGAPHPGKIIAIDMEKHNGEFIIQKGAFLCASGEIHIDIKFNRKLGTGLFGGEGFIMQRLVGNGVSFVHACGAIEKRVLGDGEELRLDTGCLVGFEKGVDFDIKFVGGLKNALFGGEGLFLSLLVGPGTVYMQSLPFRRLSHRIVKAAAFGSSAGEQGGVRSLMNPDSLV